uniref:Uncharacterized protein n=1 Tax=Ditylenchus dipsaci TaxID=166011 RepID=A0A915DRB5_9BILA
MFFLFATAPIIAQDTEINYPRHFVFVKNEIPTIEERLFLYNTKYNLVGKSLDGFSPKAKAMLTRKATEALAKAQKDFLELGYSLVIYGAYHPIKTTIQLINWMYKVKTDDEVLKKKYFPYIGRKGISFLSKCYNPTGNVVDLTLIPIGKKLKPIKFETRTLGDGSQIEYMVDGSVDMGCSFDTFDVCSAHGFDDITDQQKK